MFYRSSLFKSNRFIRNRARFNDLADLKDLFLEEKKYTLEEMPCKDPYSIFKIWFQEARESAEIVNPSIMCLATATRTGIPSLRYMLCDSFNERGFKFFTYHSSRKGEELKQNPLAAMCFFWAPFLRTIRIEGHVEQVPDNVSDELFDKRSYESQINMHCSSQTERIASSYVLEEREREKRKIFQSTPIPRPQNFGWYVLTPSVVEFWQIKQKKERVRYRKPSLKEDELTYKGDKGWVYEYLEP
ncbi:hypothetical protein Trydic_g11010 [Trypoxylus dichotomus]